MIAIFKRYGPKFVQTWLLLCFLEVRYLCIQWSWCWRLLPVPLSLTSWWSPWSHVCVFYGVITREVTCAHIPTATRAQRESASADKDTFLYTVKCRWTELLLVFFANYPLRISLSLLYIHSTLTEPSSKTREYFLYIFWCVRIFFPLRFHLPTRAT